MISETRWANSRVIGSSPRLTKEAVVGMVFKMAERLANDREDYKSADALLKLAEMQGWVGAEPDSLWKVFSGLSQADIDEVKERLRQQQEAPPAEPQQPDRANEPKQVN